MTGGLISTFFLLGLVALLVIGAVALVKRSRGGVPSDDVTVGADVLTYFLLGIAVGVAVFSIQRLAQAAFPGSTFIFEPERQVATSLAAISVSGPVATFLWIRQRRRRLAGAGEGGWVLYLTLIEMVFMTSFSVALFRTLDWLIADGSSPAIVELVVFGAAVAFHEFAVRSTPPSKESWELPRVVGSAVGLIPLAVGVAAIVHSGLAVIYDSIAFHPGGMDALTSLAWVLTGLPIWWYRWLRGGGAWHGPVGRAWAMVVATFSLAVLVGSTVTIVANTLRFLLGDTADAGTHFQFLPLTVALILVAAGAWHHHRGRLGRERIDAVRYYEYLSAAIGLMAMAGAATALFSVVFGPRSFVGGDRTVAIVAVTVALGGFAMWYRFWSRAAAAPRAEEAASTPRRLYLLIFGVIAAVTSAVALIAVLVFVFQAALGVDTLTEAMVPTIGLVLTSGAVAFHLLRTYARDRQLSEATEEKVAPFDVVVVCSHPGDLALRLPDAARVRVTYRADDLGVIDEATADAIVRDVGHRSSIVWVDETGHRVAPLR